MRDIALSLGAIKHDLGFKLRVSMSVGVVEVRGALETGLIKGRMGSGYPNARS